MRNPATGETSGPSYDLARELARRNNLPLHFEAVANPPAVIDAVKTGAADIGFVAYEATRVGTVQFSETYMLVRQSFLVLDTSPIRTVADIDQPGRKIAGTFSDSITLCLKRILAEAALVEINNNPTEIMRSLATGQIDAFGANRQRLAALAKSAPGARLLPDDLFSVPQNIVVPQDRPTALIAVNALIDEMRASGALLTAIEKGGSIGVSVAPAGIKAGCPGRSRRGEPK
jgi:polar amino acid transport system substrate-binding protein